MAGRKEQLDWIKERCSSLWTLWFVPRPIAGGYAFFNAAINSGYSMMFIDDQKEIYGPGYTPSWKRDFDPRGKGLIGGTVPTYNNQCYFCKEKNIYI